jgi:hypothetical protein
MTQEDFLIVAARSGSTNPTDPRINIWYTVEAPYMIQGISVPILDANGNSTTQYLQQITEITLPVAGDGNKTLKITERSLQRGEVLNFYFFNVKELPIVNRIPTDVPAASVIFTPGFIGLEFVGSDYNVLAGSIEDQRQSSYIFQSDRYTIRNTGTGVSLAPLNFDALKAGTALKAKVQDSNYDDTGWTKARYEGTTTDRLDYGEVDPAIQGNVFKGEYFPSSRTDQEIKNYWGSTAELPFKDYLFTGNADTPKYTTTPISYRVYSALTVVPTTSQIIISSSVYTNSINILPKVGDLFTIGSGSQEVLKALTITTIYDPPGKLDRFAVEVVRGWNSTVKQTYTSPIDTTISVINPVKVYNLLNNKLQSVNKGKILTQTTNEVLMIDPLGYIISSSVIDTPNF